MDQKLSPGSSLGPYKIIRLIGQGGMGEVYEAFEEVLQRSVALKIITDKAVTGIPEVLKLFMTEGKALAQLNHPNVVTIYQLGHDKGIHYIAMEYIEGIPMDEYLLRNPADLKRDLFIFYRILLGVQALHKKGIIHRDLKPKNVIIQNDKVVKIVDFGIAEIVREPRPDDQQKSVPMGSVYYMSPEVSKGMAATFQSDVWSLGVLFYQLLTRQRPFTGKTQAEILAKIREEPMAFSPVTSLNLPPTYKEIALKMCKVSLAERYQSVDEILQDLGTQSNSQKAPSRMMEIGLVAFAALLIAIVATWQITKSSRSDFTLQKPLEPQLIEPSVVTPTTSSVSVAEPTTTTSTETSLQTPPAVLAQATTTTTTLQAPLKTAAAPVPAKKATLSLGSTRIKASQNKVLLNFKTGVDTRSPASVQKSILNPPVLSWHPTPQAKAYRIQISSDATFAKPLLSKEVHGTSYRWESPQPGAHFWRVQALSANKEKGEFSDLGALQIQLPSPVALRSSYKFMVKSTDRSEHKNVIEWRAVPLASQYQVSLFKKNSAGSPMKEEWVRGTRMILESMPVGEYDLQVVALDLKRQPASQPALTATIQFQAASRLVAPILQQPNDGATVPSQGTMVTPIACSWSEIKSVSTYEYQLAVDPTFRQVTHQAAATKNQYVLILPLTKGKYYWRVRATSKSEDPSAWSKPRSFTID